MQIDVSASLDASIPGPEISVSRSFGVDLGPHDSPQPGRQRKTFFQRSFSARALGLSADFGIGSPAQLTPTLEMEIVLGFGGTSWNHTFGPFSIDALSMNLGTPTFDRHRGTTRTIRLRDIGTRPTRVPPPR